MHFAQKKCRLDGFVMFHQVDPKNPSSFIIMFPMKTSILCVTPCSDTQINYVVTPILFPFYHHEIAGGFAMSTEIPGMTRRSGGAPAPFDKSG
jgi:hypothetical protein